MTANDLRKAGWNCLGADYWQHPYYPGKLFSKRDAYEAEFKRLSEIIIKREQEKKDNHVQSA